MTSKPVRISEHAGFEMKRRGINRADVIATVRNPGQVVSSIKGRRIFQSLIGAKGQMLLRVVVKESPDAYHVVTAYKTSKVDKYWESP